MHSQFYCYQDPNQSNPNPNIPNNMQFLPQTYDPYSPQYLPNNYLIPQQNFPNLPQYMVPTQNILIIPQQSNNIAPNFNNQIPQYYFPQQNREQKTQTEQPNKGSENSAQLSELFKEIFEKDMIKNEPNLQENGLPQPGNLDLPKPGNLGLPQPGILDLPKPGILGLPPPGILDLPKPGNLGLK